MRYDIFLSKNTKDTKEADILYNYLSNAGLIVFESSRSLPQMGLADYAKSIDNALEQSENLIILCSPNEHGTGEGDSSRWVYYEWTSFRNELFSKRKNGNIVIVLCDGVTIKDLAFGLRKYEVFQLSSIKESHFLQYFGVQDSIHDNISSFENNSPLASELQMFDFGHHYSLCIFAKMQQRDDFSELIEEDLKDISLLPWEKAIEVMAKSPDEVTTEIQNKYGDTSADIFTLGQLCGICSLMALFWVMGADISKQQFESSFVPLQNKANSLGVSAKNVKLILSMIEEKDQNRIANYYKIIRRAIAIRHSTLVQCPYCGQNNANDQERCSNCHSILHQNSD